MGPLRSLTRRPRHLAAALVVGWAIVIAIAAWALASTQAASRSALASRLQSRVRYAASFVSFYAHDLLSDDQTAARTWLAGPRIDRVTLARTSAALGLVRAAAVEAPAGSQAPSSISLTEIRGAPAVSFAVRYRTPYGARLFSGSYMATDTMLPPVLAHLLSTSGWRAYLIDSTGGRLLAGPAASPTGALADASARVSGTAWRLVVRDPVSQLYGSVDGTDRWLAWLALAGLAVAGLLAIALFARLQRRRAQLTTLNHELVRLATVDPLTGLPNRRAIEQRLSEVLSAARRHELSLSLLVIDIDHFKRFNDQLGHQIGDAVLAHTARVLDGALRTEDAIGRWGGEEFLVVLPATDEAGARTVTERLRSALAAQQPEETKAHELSVTVTIGVAEWGEESIHELVSRADHALYLGKEAGRDTVEVAGVEPVPAAARRIR